MGANTHLKWINMDMNDSSFFRQFMQMSHKIYAKKNTSETLNNK